MITTDSIVTPGINFLHNGDFSGDVNIGIGVELRHLRVEPYDDGTLVVRIPFEDIKHLVARYIQNRKIEELENMEVNEILGIE